MVIVICKTCNDTGSYRPPYKMEKVPCTQCESELFAVRKAIKLLEDRGVLERGAIHLPKGPTRIER